MKIAIIGAGTSGLAVAYYLKQAGHQVEIFEKSDRLGGNAHTIKVKIGDEIRWADLGVNDFNASTYTHIKGMLDRLKVPYKPLENSVSFTTYDGSLCYTLDGKWNTAMPLEMQFEYQRFQQTAADEVLNNPHFHKYTVSQYLEEKKYSADFVRYCLLPRINAMYYVNDIDPNTMPILAILRYYILQEGFGKGLKSQRMYFVNGASSWIEALAKNVNAPIYFETSVKFSASSDGVILHTPEYNILYDLVITACHANTALKLFRKGLTEQMASILGAIHHCSSMAIAHTYSGIMPLNCNAWRTYNILIRSSTEQLRPYSISYLCNRHQNDAQNEYYSHGDRAQFFVTLNPQKPIPDEYVLRTPEGKKAVTYFSHNVLDYEALEAQEKIPLIQGQNNVFFVGGWTYGAGLQEECWISAKTVASQILGQVLEPELTIPSLAMPSESRNCNLIAS